MTSERRIEPVAAGLSLVVCLVVLGAPGRAQPMSTPAFVSHAPMRPLPRASARPLEGGPHKFVAPGGTDQGPGTRSEPWRTVAYALKRLVPGDTLVLREGVYYERLEIELTATAQRPITIRSHPNELAILDGGFREFMERPTGAWEPVADGAQGEFRSVRAYPGLGRAQGLFGDSMVPLHSYTWLADLRSNAAVWSGKIGPLYCGPGLWYNPRTRRIHARLAHDRASYFPPERRYRGATDPRAVALVVSGADRLPLRVRDSSHLVIEDLVVRGAGVSAIDISSSHSIRLDAITVFSGYHGLRLENTRAVRIFNSRFRGPSAPWSSRTSLKYKGTAGVLMLTRGVTASNADLEIAGNEFTDGHDGVFLGEARAVDFYDNLVENFNDDGVFLTSRFSTNGPIRIFRNHIRRCLSSFAFGWGRRWHNRTGAGVFIYRNVVEHLDRVYYALPAPGQEMPVRYGNLVRDHGSPTWEPMKIYQNTFVIRRAEGWSHYLLGLATHMRKTTREVYNNMFVHVEDSPGLGAPIAADVALRSNGNLFWSEAGGQEAAADLFARYRASTLFENGCRTETPGRESESVYGDPAFLRFDPSRRDNDYRLGAASAAVDAGVGLPPAWPDAGGAPDAGAPDIGALPAGAQPLDVGPRFGVRRQSRKRSERSASGSRQLSSRPNHRYR